MGLRALPYLGIAVITGLLLLRPISAHAAGLSFTTSPVVLSLDIRPGASDTRNLQLLNNGSQPVQIDMHLNVFRAQGNSGDAVITEPEPGDPSANWVSFSPSTFVAKPGVWSQVKMTIHLPVTANLGYYYAVLFKPEQEETPTKNAVVVEGSNATLVLIDTHTGDESRQLAIDDFVTGQGLYEYLPATFHVHIRNNGNIYQSPMGNIFVSQSSDLTNDVAALDVNPGEGNILPHTARDFTVDWSDGFPVFEDKKVNGQVVQDDHGNAVKELSWSFAKLNKVRFGQYYAKVTVIYNDGTRVIPLSRVVSFWVIPWKLILVILFVVGVLIVGLLTIGRFSLRIISRKKVYRM